MARTRRESEAEDGTRTVMRFPRTGELSDVEVLVRPHQRSIFCDAIARCTLGAIRRYVVGNAWDELLRLCESGEALLRDQDILEIEAAVNSNQPVNVLLALICKAIIAALVATKRVGDLPRQILLEAKVHKQKAGSKAQQRKKQQRIKDINAVVPPRLWLETREDIYKWLKKNHPHLVEDIELRTFQNYKLTPP